MTIGNSDLRAASAEASSATAPAIIALDTDRAAAAIFAVLLGVFIVFGAGLAHSDILHNAAHDSRHSFSFPCH